MRKASKRKVAKRKVVKKTQVNLAKKLTKTIQIYWSGRLDLNQRPLAPEASALPNCATSRLRCFEISTDYGD